MDKEVIKKALELSLEIIDSYMPSIRPHEMAERETAKEEITQAIAEIDKDCWKYPAKGELPDVDIDVFCLRFETVPCVLQLENNKKTWYNDEAGTFYELEAVTKWMYIPK